MKKKTDCNTKITEIDGKMSNSTGLPTTASLTAVENKIPDVSNLVKKTYCDAKYQTLNLNILLRLITRNLLVKHLMQR